MCVTASYRPKKSFKKVFDEAFENFIKGVITREAFFQVVSEYKHEVFVL